MLISENTNEKGFIAITQDDAMCLIEDENFLGTSAAISNGLEQSYDLDLTI